MERLTNSDKEIPTLVDNAEYWLQVYFKLKDIEGLEEQGLLLRLPCKVGTEYLDFNGYKPILRLTKKLWLVGRIGNSLDDVTVLSK